MEFMCKDVICNRRNLTNEKNDGLFNKWSLGWGSHFIGSLYIIITKITKELAS